MRKALLTTAIILWITAVLNAATVNIDTYNSIRTIPDEIFGHNISVYESSADDFGTTDYNNYVAATQQMNPGLMRIPGGLRGDQWDWEQTRSLGTDINTWEVDVFEMMQFIGDVDGGLKPLIIVNFPGYWQDGTGAFQLYGHAAAVQKAADWVTYMNVTNSYDVKYWEIGNEVFGNWHPNQTTGTDYGNKFVDFWNAMKAVDPTIKLGALAPTGSYSSWTDDMMAATNAQGVVPDFFIEHIYIDNNVLTDGIDEVDTITQEYNTKIASVYGPAYVGQIEYFMTEFRARNDFVFAVYPLQFIDTMFCAQAMMEMAAQGWKGSNIWALKNGYDSTAPETDYGLLKKGVGTDPGNFPANEAHNTYYIYPYLTGFMGREMVGTSTSNSPTVRAYSALDTSNNLTIMMVNNSNTTAQDITVNVSGYSVNGTSGEMYELLPDGDQSSHDLTVNGILEPNWNGLAAITPIAITVGNTFDMNVPANSIRFIRMPLDGPTPTDTDTPDPSWTDTETLTVTETPTPVGSIFNTCETLTYNGTWTGSQATHSISSTEPLAVTEGTYALRVDITTAANWQQNAVELNGFAPADWSGVVQVSADIYIPAGSEPWDASSAYKNILLYASSTTAGKSNQRIAAGQNIYTGSNHITWTLDFSLGTLLSTDPLSQLELLINTGTSATGTIYLDNIRLIYAAVDTKTPTETQTFAETETYTPTYTSTETYTIIPTATYTYTSNATPTYTNTIPAGAIAINIDVTSERTPISPLIYGVNIYGDPDDVAANPYLDPSINWAARRQGGNRLTAYNWENNASNAGADYGPNQSDPWLCTAYGVVNCDTPGEVLTKFHNDSIARNWDSLVTVQMAGFVSADKPWTSVVDPAVADSLTDRWKTVVYKKPGGPGSFTLTPDTADEYVYMDEFVNWMVNKFGGSSAADGIKRISLDNEPVLWDSTHPLVHPNDVTYAELVSKSIALAEAVKDVDSGVELFGPALFGWSAFQSLNSATDAATEGAGYSWFVDYYLDKMKDAGTAYGSRLLDVFDIHWYPEDNGGNCRIVYTAYDADCSDPNDFSINSDARMQAPRTLWDASYIEDSWIPSPVRLIPRLQESIDSYYPGTKIAITEYDFGGGTHYSAGIAQADALGVFGKFGVYAAYAWDITPGDYTLAGVKLYRNYDGSLSTYGDTKVKADTANVASLPVYASQFNGDDSKLHIILINRSGTAQNANVNITGPYDFESGRVWAFDSTTYNITERTSISSISGNSFVYNIPAYTAAHIVLETLMLTPTDTETPDPLWTVTDTPTITSTPTETATATDTPLITCLTIDDCEIINGKNLLAGDWYTYADTNGVSNITGGKQAPGGPVSTSGLFHFEGYLDLDPSWAGAGTNFDAVSDAEVDMSAYDKISFYFRGDGNSYVVRIRTGNITDNGYYQRQFSTTNGSWELKEFDFSTFTQPYGAVESFDLARAQAIQWSPVLKDSAFSADIDDIALCTSLIMPTETETATTVFTDTTTETQTPVDTETLTATPTHTDTSTETETETFTQTETYTTISTETQTPTPTDTVPPGCFILWQDEFDGSAIDTNKWTFEFGNSGWGNNELQYYTDRAENARIENGELVIEAREEVYGGANYTSARMITQGKFSGQYGRVEARVKLPQGQGIWPAFWMLGDNIGSVGWPACGEIDIIEMIGGGEDRDDTLYGTAHWDDGGHAQYGGNTELPDPQIFADDYHIFGIEWDTTAIRWYLDGVQYHVIDITPAGLSEFHNNFFLILNIAVGGDWPGSPDATTVFPQTMNVDWIRWYDCINDTPTPSDTPTETYTETFTETETETFVPTETETPSITDTVPPGSTDTYTPTDTPTDTSIPTGTPSSTSSVSNTETPTETFTETETETFVPTETETPTITDTVPPGSTDTYTPTETYTQTFTQTYTMTATSTPTLSINITLASPSTINVGIDTDLYVYFDNNRAVTSIDAQLQDIFGTPLQTVTLPASAFAAGSNSIIIPLDDAVNGFDLAAVASDSYRLVLIAANGVDTAASPMSLLTINGAPTVTETETLPAANTSTETPTFTYTHTFTETPVLTNTETQTPYPSVTPTPTQGDTLEITELLPYPNPFNPTLPGASARFTFKISQTDIDSIALRMYTSGYRLVKEVIFEEGALAQVLSRKYIQYNAEDLLNMANGTYYYLIIAEKDGEVVRSKVDKLIILK